MRRLRRALVVGGAGFVGGWLVRELALAGVEPIVVDRNPREGVHVVGDVQDVDLDTVLAAAEPDAVFQLAGTGLVPLSVERPLADLDANTATTLTVLEAARRAARPPVVCLVSSAAVYGEGRRVPIAEDHPLEPVSPYGISKLAAERYMALYASLHDLRTFSVRPFSLYGPGQRKLVVHDLALRLLSGDDPLSIMAVPEVSRDFVYAGDAAAAMVHLARVAPARGEAYNIASGRATSLAELVATLVEAAAVEVDVRFAGVLRPGDPVRLYGDGSLARSLGATFDTPLAEGIARTFAWLSEVREEHVVG